MEQTDACQPPKWKCWTTRELGILQTDVAFQWLELARGGFLYLFCGSEWLGVVFPATVSGSLFFSEKWLNNGFEWLNSGFEWL